ncbi:hypothetical protein B566_EDAN011212 [Ephemera danica]|nr:hypothetical protein B566_EDAN011212 [Ephemera danica]
MAASLTRRHPVTSPPTARRPTFMPSRSLASATRIINQHLFGSMGRSTSKGSLSAESIDSPSAEQRKKSILKKSESSGHKTSAHGDPETEQLISCDPLTSGADVASGDMLSNSSPILRPMRSSGDAKSSRTATPIKFVGIQSDACTSDMAQGLSKFSRRRPPPPSLKSPPADEPLEKGVAKCGHHLLGASGNPACGCNPQTQAENIVNVTTSPQPQVTAEQQQQSDSPTEETKLLQQNLTQVRKRQQNNDFNNYS